MKNLELLVGQLARAGIPPRTGHARAYALPSGCRLNSASGREHFLPRGQAHAFYIRSPCSRVLLLVAAGEEAVGTGRYFTEMATPATSMDLPAKALTYAVTDAGHAIALGRTRGIRILSPEETLRKLLHYPSFEVETK